MDLARCCGHPWFENVLNSSGTWWFDRASPPSPDPTSSAPRFMRSSLNAPCTFEETAASLLLGEDDPPWEDHEPGDHLSATRQAERWVFIGTDVERAALWEGSATYFDKRKTGKGLTVGIHTPALNKHSAALEKGDRLLPQIGLEDIGLYAVVSTPCWLRFWRPSRATLTTAPNPMWELGVGLSIVGNFAVDFLRTVALGVMGSIVCAVIWQLLHSDVFASRGTDKVSKFAVGISRLNAELTNWYQSERDQGRKPSEVEFITPSMFGKPTVHIVKMKAGETMDLFRWCTSSLLPTYYDRISKGAQLRACAEPLQEWTLELARQPDRVPHEACERLTKMALLHLTLLRDAGVQVKPKHHLFWHLNNRTRPLPLMPPLP